MLDDWQRGQFQFLYSRSRCEMSRPSSSLARALVASSVLSLLLCQVYCTTKKDGNFCVNYALFSFRRKKCQHVWRTGPVPLHWVKTENNPCICETNNLPLSSPWLRPPPPPSPPPPSTPAATAQGGGTISCLISSGRSGTGTTTPVHPGKKRGSLVRKTQMFFLEKNKCVLNCLFLLQSPACACATRPSPTSRCRQRRTRSCRDRYGWTQFV